jgi:hypothetical protein
MIPKTAFFRFLAVPACLVWGLVEFIALQRAHLVQTERPNAKTAP